MTVHRNVPRFCTWSICDLNLFQPLGLIRVLYFKKMSDFFYHFFFFLNVCSHLVCIDKYTLEYELLIFRILKICIFILMSSVCWCGICDRQLSNQSHFTQYNQIRSHRRISVTGVIFWLHELIGGCPGTSKITSPGGFRSQESNSDNRDHLP